MARVPMSSRDDYPEEHRATYDRMQQERGNPTPHVFLALANMPNLLDALLTFTIPLAGAISSKAPPSAAASFVMSLIP